MNWPSHFLPSLGHQFSQWAIGGYSTCHDNAARLIPLSRLHGFTHQDFYQSRLKFGSHILHISVAPKLGLAPLINNR